MGNQPVIESPEKYIKLSEQCFDEKRYKDYAYNRAIFLLRLLQDASCSIYSLNSENIDLEKILIPLKFQSKKEEIMKFYKSECLKNAVDKIRTDTLNDKLENPSWVNQYYTSNFSMSVATGICMETETIPQDKWKETRLEVINMMLEMAQ